MEPQRGAYPLKSIKINYLKTNPFGVEAFLNFPLVYLFVSSDTNEVYPYIFMESYRFSAF